MHTYEYETRQLASIRCGSQEQTAHTVCNAHELGSREMAPKITDGAGAITFRPILYYRVKSS
jgi:hypothetical protein